MALSRYRSTTVEPLVIGVSLDTRPAREGVSLRDPDFDRTIQFVDGSVLDPELPEHVAELLPPGSRCLVIEDTAHEYETTAAALRGYARFVCKGGYFVVEDGVVDDPDLGDRSMGGGGVLSAVQDWLASDAGAEFEQRRDLELYGMTSSPAGWIQRRQ